MKLTKKQQEELWGETGPYSQVNLKIETRILDDKISRVFLIVETEINPFTFKVIEQNKKQFKDDPEIMGILEYSEDKGQHYGYVANSFCQEFRDESVMELAQERLRDTNEAVIKIHKFVMDLLK